MSVSDLYITRIGPHTVFGCSKIERPILEIYKSLTDTVYECRNWERYHFNSVFANKKTAHSCLGIHNWEPDIYIGFAPALHLQCTRLTRVSRKTEKNRIIKEQRIGQIKKARVGETVHGIQSEG